MSSIESLRGEQVAASALILFLGEMLEIDYSNFVIAAYAVSAVGLSGLFLLTLKKYILLKKKLKNAE